MLEVEKIAGRTKVASEPCSNQQEERMMTPLFKWKDLVHAARRRAK